ncbi:MAG: flagellar biosynthesis protein FlhA [Phycisphaerae bacterium]|nr:flagellar biosynthesis protein FlhA [Phycisphaerae bacterium]
MSPQSDTTLSGSLVDSSRPGLSRLLANNDILFAICIAVVMAAMLFQLPTSMLDMLLSCSIAVSIATLVAVLATRESIEFSAFPSLLLFVTLFRLSLNVASTRLILLQGDAGKIIGTFGHFVVGSSLVVGLVVFLILVVIQFVVITKGAERISEVAARFNLDAMPGKQMAIDADLNAGLIGEDEARQRRTKIVSESEFYGAMDGASKFIRGDAIAGLIITCINLIGGFVVGTMHGMSAGESVSTYSILAIGDGLVSQIPAVIISTASGFLISKASSKSNVSTDLTRQFLARSRPIAIAAFLLGGMVLVPGFPKVPFVILALAGGVLARAVSKLEKETAGAAPKAESEPQAEQAPVEELLDIDRISIQVGPRLIKTIDPRRKGSLSQRIAPLRRKFAQEYGIVLPLVRLRDNISLEGNTYQIRINNHVISAGKLEPDKLLAMDPGTVQQPIQGVPAKEPVFNLPVIWINPDQKEQAELAGYTVVEPESVLMTHLSETLRKHTHELLSRDDVQRLTDRLREKQPSLINGVLGEIVPMGLLHRVLQNLLRDGIAIRDLAQIMEALGDHATRTKDPSALTEFARKALVRTITEQHTDSEGRITAIVLEPALEYELRNSITRDAEGESLAIPPDRALQLSQQIADLWRRAMNEGHDKTVLLCNFKVRPHLAPVLARQVPQLPVLAYDELAVGTKIESVGTVSLQTETMEAITSDRS